MKNLRSSFLRCSGNPVLHGLQPANRVFYRTSRRPSIVFRNSRYGNATFPSKRFVSTAAGPRKNSVAVVTQSPATLPPCQKVNSLLVATPYKHPDGLRSYVSGSKKLPQAASGASNTMCYGEFLGSKTHKASYLDPISIETAFMPTFCLFQKEFGNIFIRKPTTLNPPVLYPATETESQCESGTEESVANSEKMNPLCSWETNASWSPSLQDSSSLQCLVENTRDVQMNTVLPRKSENLSSQERLQIFFDVHRFEENESDSQEKSEKKDIGGFPTSSDHSTLPTGQFIIHSDRSALIINKDLYITNRILDNLKKRKKNPSVDNPATPDPVVKVSSSLTDARASHGTPSPDRGNYMSQLEDPLIDIELDPSPSYTSNTLYLIRKSKSDSNIIIDAKNAFQKDHEHSSSTAHTYHQLSDCYGCNLDNFQPKTVYAEPQNSTEENFPDNVSFPDSFSGNHLSNAEFSKVKVNRLSSLEAASLNSRKNLYTRLMRTTPCYLVDGFHIQEGKVKEHLVPNEPGYPDEYALPNHGNPSDIVSRSNKMVPLPAGYIAGKLMPEKPLDEWRGNQNVDERASADLEDWFFPLDQEIDSMLTTLSAETNTEEQNKLLGSGMFSNSDLEAQFGIEPFIDLTEFKDVTSDDLKILRTPDVLFGDGFPPFESPEALGSALISPQDVVTFNSTRGRFNSSSSSHAPPPKQKNPNVHIETKTTINCFRSGDTTDINVTETQKYLDKRLPYPFSTETVLQVYGTNESLQKATQAVENSKAQLVHLSNANHPNPGMLIPKLQFNHMLSKAHEHTNANARSKKHVFKIKVVPDTSSTSPPTPRQITESLSEPNSMSNIVHPTKQLDTDRETLELMKKSRYMSKPNLKKLQTKFRTKKKRRRGEDEPEPITVLSPKELEKMFPAPPKPKPVEKPRKVTINTNDAKISQSSINLVGTAKSVGKIALQAQKAANEWSLAKSKSAISKLPAANETRSVPLPAENEKETLGQKTGSGGGSGLSQRDEKILKSIISHKVKDSFGTVTKREKTYENASTRTKSEGSGDVTPRPIDAHARGMAEIRKQAMLSQTKNQEPKIVKSSESLELVKGPAVRGLDKQHDLAKSTMSIKIKSPTPIENRQYIFVKRAEDEVLTKGVDDLKLNRSRMESNKNKSSKLSNISKPSIASDKSDTKSPRPSSDKFSKSGLQNILMMYEALQPKLSSSPKVIEKKSNEKIANDTKNTDSLGTHKKKTEVTPMKIQKQSFEPIFFPFETPSVKEFLTNPQGEVLHLEQSSDLPMKYELDFCKLSKEMKPGLNMSAQCKVPLTRVKEFPMVNSSDGVKYSTKRGVISINSNADVLLRKTLSGMPAVTKVLGETMSAKSQLALDRWKQGLIQTLGEEGFKEFYENQLRQGSSFHSSVGNFLMGRSECKDDLCMKSMAHVFPAISDVGVVESQVVHPQLAYRGVIDCVAKYKGKPVIIEWKRADKSKPTIKHTYDAPLQLSAYLGAFNYDNNYKMQVEGGLIVVAYSNGSPADVFEISLEDCEQYWSKWLKRLYKFYTRP